MAAPRGHPWYKDGIFAGYPDYRYGRGADRPIATKASSLRKPIYTQGKRKHLISQILLEMADWRSSPFEKEGPLRASLRAALCLQGHSWGRSDAEAEFLVSQALNATGVPRPSWNEGQPGHVDSPDRCTWCARPVDDAGNGKAVRYCSVICATASRNAMTEKIHYAYDKAYAAAERVILKSRQKARTCDYCGTSFQPIREKSKQRFCSFSCGAKGAARTKPICHQYSNAVEMECVYCGSDFEAISRTALVCSKRCSLAWQKLKVGREPQMMKPHVFDRYITMQVDPPKLTPGKLDWLFLEAGKTITAEAVLPRVTDGLFA